MKKLTIIPKLFTINDVIYAKYQLDGDHLFLKVVGTLVPGNKIKNENTITQIIGMAEGVEIKSVSFLNIK